MYRDFFAAYVQIMADKANDSGEYPALCPFHQDSNPSFYFNDSEGLWYCQACEEGGDAPGFLVKLHGLSRAEAEEEVRRQLGTALPGEGQVAAWSDTLWQTLSVLGYLRGRGLTDDGLLRRYQIGWDSERITIPVRDKRGVLVNIRRHLPGAKRNKVINWPGYGSPPHLWPTSNLTGDGPVVICEGEIDCLTAIQQGFRTVTSTAGAGIWRSEWSQEFSGQDVLIAFDGDEAGRKGAAKAAEALRRYAKSVRVLPIPDGEDVNSLHQKGVGLAEIISQPSTAHDDLAEEIAGIPKDLADEEKLRYVEDVLEKIVGKNPVQQEHYIARLRQATGYSKDTLRKHLQFVQSQKNQPTVPEPLREPRQSDICVAQDWRDGVFHYGVWLPTKNGEWIFRLVTSDRRLLEAPEEADLPPNMHSLWSVDAKTPGNVFAWLRGETEPIDAAALYQNLAAFYRRFVWYPDPTTYGVLALWTMATYVFMLFNATSYLATIGTQQSGKSLTQELLGLFAFNAVAMASLGSVSFLFRTVHTTRCTLLVDEADAAKGGGQEVDERLSVIRSGYKYTGAVGRVEGDGHVPKLFSTYSPKVLANTVGLESALEDRVIHIRVLTKPPTVEVEPLFLDMVADEAQLIRNRLYAFGLEYAARISNERLSVIQQKFDMSSREVEVWLPLLTVARFVSQQAYDEAVAFAYTSKEAKRAREDATSPTNAVIRACYQLLKEEEPDEGLPGNTSGGWYERGRIKERVAAILDWDAERLSSERIRTELVNSGVIERTVRYRKQFWSGPHRGKRAYLLLPDMVLAAAERRQVALDD